MTPRAPGIFQDLRTRLVGGSLFRRTVVTVAAFTMTTVLLLGLLSAAAIGATRAVVGAPADDPSVSTSAAEADEDGASGDGSAAKPTRAKASTTKKAAQGSTAKGSRGDKASVKSEPRRAGGAVSPGDALKHRDDASEEEQ